MRCVPHGKPEAKPDGTDAAPAETDDRTIAEVSIRDAYQNTRTVADLDEGGTCLAAFRGSSEIRVTTPNPAPVLVPGGSTAFASPGCPPPPLLRSLPAREPASLTFG